MAWRDMFRAPAGKSNPVGSLIVLGLSGADPTPKASLQRQADDGYLRNTTVYQCVRLLSRAGAGVPWTLWERRGTTRATRKFVKHLTPATAATCWQTAFTPAMRKAVEVAEIDSHAALALIEKPNPQDSQASFIEAALGFLLIAGNNYLCGAGPDAATAPDGRAPFTELYLLRPDRVTVKAEKNPSLGELVKGYAYTVGSKKSDPPFPPARVLHQKFFHPLDDWYGLSPIQVASLVIDGDNAAKAWNAKLVTNHGRPPSALQADSSLDQTVRDRLKLQLEEYAAGGARQGKTLVLEGGLKWQNLAITPVDADWLDGQRMSKREICGVYSVPPEMTGDPEAKTYNSYPEAKRALYTEGVIPNLERLRDDLNRWLMPRFGDRFFLDIDRDAIPALQEDLERLWLRVERTRSLSLNEKRDALGYDAIEHPDADTPEVFLRGPAADLLALPPLPGIPGKALGDVLVADVAGERADEVLALATKARVLTRDQKTQRAKLRKALAAYFRDLGADLSTHLASGVHE